MAERNYAGAGEECRLPLLLLNIGSTTVRAVKVESDFALRGTWKPRKAGEDIVSLVDAAVAELGGAPGMLICSSANDGLKIGLLCLSRRFSGAILQRTLQAIGAHVAYGVTWHEACSPGADLPPVDILILAGGVDTFSAATVEAGLHALAAAQPHLGRFPHRRMIFAGHAGAAGLARQFWPRAELLPNPLRDSFVFSESALADHVRECFIADIHGRQEMQPLEPRAAAPIQPTTAAVLEAYARLSKYLAAPALMVDIGGATTEVHFPRELLTDEAASGGLTGLPEFGCHIHAALGTGRSRHATVTALLADPSCADFLIELHGDGFRAVHADLLEGAVDDRTLAAGCLFIALRATMGQGAGGPQLQTGRIATLAVTGGGAQLLGPGDCARLVHLAVGQGAAPQILLDRDYNWWALGLMPGALVNERIMEAMNV